MNDFPRWKSVLVVVVLLLGILYGVPNLYVQQPAVIAVAAGLLSWYAGQRPRDDEPAEAREEVAAP